MPPNPRNGPEQEHSIKARSHALFFEEDESLPVGSGKPFAAYLRETPARPMSPAIKALFWFLALIVAVLFFAAIWRVATRRAGRPPATAARERTVMSGLDRRSIVSG